MPPVELSRLHDRLRLAAGERSFRAIGEMTGHKTETVRRYLTGQPPSVEFLAAFSHALGLRADWLLLGRGPAHIADEHKHALKKASPEELLAAVAETVEVIQDRIDRIERYLHALEARTRGLAQLAQVAVAQPPKARKRESHAEGASGHTIQSPAEQVAHAIARRPPADAG